MEQTASNKAEFLKLIEADDEAHAKKMVYKGTNCGAWLHFDTGSIHVGSIVEGVDEGTQSYCLEYPITISTFWEKLALVEMEADQIWKDTHGCKSCGPERETGHIAINGACLTCGGYGVII